MAQWLSERLGQPFVVENRPGANATIALQAAVNSPPDGYTLVSVSSSNASNEAFNDSLSFNLQRDLIPVASVSAAALVLEVTPSLPVQSVSELIAHAKINPGKISVASFGAGSTSHLAQELFKIMTGINVNHVPYRGDAPGLTDTISGHVQATFSTVAASLEYVRTGKLRALGVTTAQRWPALPEVPTIGEFVSGYEMRTWSGVSAPKRTPPEIIEKLNREINAGLTDAKIKTRIADLGSIPTPLSQAEFEKFIADDIEKWRHVIRVAKIKPE